MKKIISLLITLFVFSSSFCISAYAEEAEDEFFTSEQLDYYASLGLQGQTLNVYNWGEYISDGEDGTMDVISEFKRLTGCEVNYSNFESNENLYSKLSGGGASFDVIIPSDYMIERLKDENMLVPLDFSNIPNYDKYIDQRYKGLYYDENEEYTVPYNVGTTVLIYNKNYFDKAPTSWEVLWDEKYKDRVLMFNNSRDAFAIAMSMLGYDYNTTDLDEWSHCAQLLTEQRLIVNPEYVMDEVFDKMASGDYALATYYAGDYLCMLEENEDLGYAFPSEGVNYFYDAMCIPKGYQNKYAAECFINFMHEPQVALANAEYIYYASPNTSVMTNEEYSLMGNEVVYPTKLPKTQFFRNLPQDALELMNKLWTNIKGNNDYTNVYISFGAICFIILIFIIIRIIIKKKERKMQNV